MKEYCNSSHFLSFDVEDWYQGFIYRGISGWEKYGSRELSNVQRILKILSDHNTLATFFILGNFAEKNPLVVKIIDEAGHEIASHGYSHVPIPKHTVKTFTEDIRRSVKILQDITGKEILGFRAASWSITKECIWVLDILAEEGIKYDSSIYPTNLHKFGIKNYPPYPQRINLSNGLTIDEFPAQILKLAGIRIPVAGGFYLRAFPYLFSWMGLMQSYKIRQPGMVYLHPFELDVDTPRLKVNYSFKIIRYFALSKTKTKLIRLLEDFKFSSIKDLFYEAN